MTTNQQRKPLDQGVVHSTDISQRAVFLAALLPGALAIATSRVLAMSGVWFLLVAIVIPVVCMLAYWLVNERGEFFDSTRSQVADNIYFLGFLFFLVSLSGTLILFAASEEGVRESVIVQGFGIALVTTILGLFLRILVLQQAAPVEDARERAERDLLATIVQLRAQITAGSESLRQAQEVAIASLTETSKLLVQKVTATADEIDQKVQSAASNIEARLNQIDIPADALTKAFQPLVDGVGKAVSELEQSTRGQAEAGRELAKSARSLAKPLDEATTAVGALNRSVVAAQPNVSAVAQALTQAASGSIEMAKATEATRVSVHGLESAVSNLNERVGSMQVGDHLDRAASGLKVVREEVAALQEATTHLVPEVQRSLSGLPAIIGSLGSVAAELRQAAEAVRGLVGSLERFQSPEAIRGAMDAATTMIKELRESQTAWEQRVARERQARIVPESTPPGQAATQPQRSLLGRLFGRK